MDNWQAFVPMARSSGDRPEPAAAALEEPAAGRPADAAADGSPEPGAAPPQEPEPGGPADPWAAPADPWADGPTDPTGGALAEALASLPVEPAGYLQAQPPDELPQPPDELPQPPDERAGAFG